MPPFMSYDLSDSIVMLDGTTEDVEISNKSFQSTPDCAIIVRAHNLYVHDCDFDSCVGGVLVFQSTGRLRVEDCRFRNTGTPDAGGSGRKDCVQFLYSFDDGTGGIRRNLSYGGETEDHINLYQSGGIGVGQELIVEENHLHSPLPPDPLAWASGSGSGITLDCVGAPEDSLCEFIIIRNNTALNAGQCGIGNYCGSHVAIIDNVVYMVQRDGASNAAIYTPWTGGLYGGGYGIACSDLEVSGNRLWCDSGPGSPPGNRIFAGGTYYDDPDHACIFEGGINGTVLGLSPQSNVIQDASIDPAEISIDPDTMVFGIDDGGGDPGVPTITNNYPFRGSKDGGTGIYIIGTGFTDVVSVEFGGVPATLFEVNSDTLITAITPPHAPGIAEIVLS